jgi:hypothetical protein
MIKSKGLRNLGDLGEYLISHHTSNVAVNLPFCSGIDVDLHKTFHILVNEVSSVKLAVPGNDYNCDAVATT